MVNVLEVEESREYIRSQIGGLEADAAQESDEQTRAALYEAIAKLKEQMEELNTAINGNG